jgi:hypothetical protein
VSAAIWTACAPVALVPTYTVPDTRYLNYFELTERATMHAINRAMLSYPNEYLGCLYGEVVADTALIITRIEDARIAFATPNQVKGQDDEPFGCTHRPSYLGPMHSHPTWPRAWPCLESEQDSHAFLSDPRAVLRMTMCGNGLLRFVIRDGRVFELRWGIPIDSVGN